MNENFLDPATARELSGDRGLANAQKAFEKADRQAEKGHREQPREILHTLSRGEIRCVDTVMAEAFNEVIRRLDDLQSDGASDYISRMTARVRETLSGNPYPESSSSPTDHDLGEHHIATTAAERYGDAASSH